MCLFYIINYFQTNGAHKIYQKHSFKYLCVLMRNVNNNNENDGDNNDTFGLYALSRDIFKMLPAGYIEENFYSAASNCHWFMIFYL